MGSQVMKIVITASGFRIKTLRWQVLEDLL